MLQLTSSIHLLLGKAYEVIGNYELASDEFKKALHFDIYCHEAFDRVIGHHLLTAAEGMKGKHIEPLRTVDCI